ncbi:MAG: type II toxin-antitoxin system RelE/ParE family toxin [Planctomycetota bacterium]|nr:type II toxin-antitoxin system RelE/ParE family toxin [Planctomycetota bacterium]
MKPAIFHPAALKTIRGFPDEARRAIGEAILRIQHGARVGMPLSRPMSAVAPGVAELRVKDRGVEFRTFYYTRGERGILVPHAFAKKTRATPEHEIALARQRLRELAHETI